MVIENRGGGGSNVGNEAAAKSPPDGYTILFAAFPFATNQFLYSKLTYDAVADFAPITLIGTFPNILVVPNTSPAKSVSELIALARATSHSARRASAPRRISTASCSCAWLASR
jgi:tripartite-type tricarboxylate transporter receptor subunit TctC